MEHPSGVMARRLNAGHLKRFDGEWKELTEMPVVEHDYPAILRYADGQLVRVTSYVMEVFE